MAVVFNLNHQASYVHWHFFQMSVPNVLLIAAMFVVFFAAILIRFPRHRGSGADESGRADGTSSAGQSDATAGGLGTSGGSA